MARRNSKSVRGESHSKLNNFILKQNKRIKKLEKELKSNQSSTADIQRGEGVSKKYLPFH